MKLEAEVHPERPPSGILRDEMQGLSQRVLARLPERENMKRAIRKARRRNLPPNPRTLAELQEVPERFQNTLTGEKFLIFDTRDEGEDDGNVIVFATKRNFRYV